MGKSIPFYKMNISETARAGERVHAAASEINNEALTATQMLPSLETSNNNLKEAQTKLSPQEQTELMKVYDGHRDRTYKSWKYAILSAEYRNDETKQKASDLLKSVLIDYGWNAEDFAYSKETDTIDAIVLKVENTDELIEANATIGAQGIFAELKEGNENFKASEKRRTELRAAGEKLVPGEICKQVEASCQLLTQYVGVMNQVSPNADFKAFLDEVNVIAEEMHTSINIRTAKNQEAEQISE